MIKWKDIVEKSPNINFKIRGYDKHPDVGEGWHQLLSDLCKELEEELIKQNAFLEIAQIKEKFGGLRFYVNIIWRHEDESLMNAKKLNEIIWNYESKSTTVCEVCGEPGTLKDKGWIKTYCDKHRKEMEDKMNAR